MPTAKSYLNMKHLSEPFLSKGKMYISVEDNHGRPKTVRWYTDQEFARLYPNVQFTPKTQIVKDVLGFQKGYITIFRGNTKAPEVEEWCRYSPKCRYHTTWGWYIVSNETLPDHIPAAVAPVQLLWDNVGNPDGTLKAPEVVATAVKEAIK